MNAAMISAIATLLSEAVITGYSVSAILKEAKEKGGISDETWDQIMMDVDGAVAEWNSVE